MTDYTFDTLYMPELYGSGSSVGGPSTTRTAQSVENDRWNVVNYGLDDSGTDDCSLALSIIGSNSANRTVSFPFGTHMFTFSVYFVDTTLVEIDSGAYFTGTEAASSNVFADESVVSEAQATKILARLSAHGDNSPTLHLSEVVRTGSSATANFEKEAL